MKILVVLLISLISVSNMASQSLSEYQWKNRLILVFTDNEQSQEFERQFEEFKEKSTGFKNRKLKLIHAIPQKSRIVFPEKTEWKSANFYENKKETESEFEIILNGLDGSVKLRQTEILETEKLFSLIDSMPMRQAEMRKNN